MKAALLTRDGAVVNPALTATSRAPAETDGPRTHGNGGPRRLTEKPWQIPHRLRRSAGELAGDAGALARKLDALSQQLALATAAGGGACRHAVRLRADGLRARRVRRLLRGLAGDAGAALAADERHQRGLERHHRRRADRGRARPSISFAKIMGFVAVTLAAVNIFGGFIVTQRMLQMFQRKK